MTRFYHTNSSFASSLGAADAYETSAESTHTPDDAGNAHLYSIAGQASGIIGHVYTCGNEATDIHNSITWPTSNWGVSVDVSTAGADVTYSMYLQRVSAAGVPLGTAAVMVFNVTGTGIKVAAPRSWNDVNNTVSTSADVVSCLSSIANAHMMTAQGLGLNYSDSDSWFENTDLSPPAGTPQVVCPLISASSSLFNPTIINTQEINLNVLNVPGSILSPAVVPPPSTLQFQVITVPSTLFNPTVVQNVILPVISVPSSLFDPSIVQDVTLPVVDTPSTIFNPTIFHRFLVSMQLLTADSTIFSPTVNQDVALNVVNSTTTVFNPELSYDVVLPVLNAPDNVLSPATDTSVNVEMVLVTADSTLFSPALDQDIALDVLSIPATVPNPQISLAGTIQDISLVTIDAASTVLDPSVTTLTTVEAQVFDSPSTVFSPSLKYEVIAPVVVTVSTIFSPSLEQIVEMQLVSTAPNVHAPRIGEAVDDGSTSAIINRPGFPPFPIGIS